MPLECEHKGWTIWAYDSARFHERWIHSPEDLWIRPWREFDSRKVSTEDCKRIIDMEVLKRSGNAEQLSLF